SSRSSWRRITRSSCDLIGRYGGTVRPPWTRSEEAVPPRLFASRLVAMSVRLRTLLLVGAAVSLLLGTAGPAAASGPGNDDLASATVLTGSSTSLSGSNVGANGETGEPDHAGASLRPDCAGPTDPDAGCESSLWWTWTAPSNGTV